MRKEGFSFEDEAEFARIYGVHSRERRYALGAGGQRERQVGSMKEKRLPGVSPLVFTKFLLERAGKVICIELDDRMISILKERFFLYDNFEIINEDEIPNEYKTQIINEIK